MTRIEDVICDSGKDLDYILAGYWHLKYGYDRAMACVNPDCHHAGMDKEAATAYYTQQLADICGQLVDLITKAM